MVVPVVVLQSPEDAEPLAEALLAGGLDVIEITFRTSAAEESIRRIAARFPEMIIGAGTLLDTEQVSRARDAGATFGLAPGLNPEVVTKAKEAGMEFSPGVMTPGEIEAALSLGCRLQKFFPAMAAGGPGMLKALAGPYAHTGVKFIPTGGVNRQNMRDFLDLPVVAAVGGSWMVDQKLIASGSWGEITALTTDALEAAATNRQDSHS
ncbi:MAG: bifunctional 4-hydroxy-2-oxoglutarate aldolase/2-dehydro-3-deoxy-phosphogluconate aldolase [Haloferula sp.]